MENEREELEKEIVCNDKMPDIASDNRGMGVVEVLLIIVVLIAMVAIFREQISGLVENIWSAINKGAKSICS